MRCSWLFQVKITGVLACLNIFLYVISLSSASGTSWLDPCQPDQPAPANLQCGGPTCIGKCAHSIFGYGWPCWCDDKCLQLGDCCAGFEEDCPAEYSKSVTFKDDLPFWSSRCVRIPVPRLVGFRWRTYRLITVCGGTGEVCEFTSTSDLLNPNLAIPIVDADTGLSFINFNCAKCNHVTNIEWWRPSISCNGVAGDPLTEITRAERLKEYLDRCQVVYRVPQTASRIECLEPEDSINTCPLTCHNPGLIEKCESTIDYVNTAIMKQGDAPFTTTTYVSYQPRVRINYKNMYCALCHNKSLGALSCVYHPTDGLKTTRPSLSPVSTLQPTATVRITTVPPFSTRRAKPTSPTFIPSKIPPPVVPPQPKPTEFPLPWQTTTPTTTDITELATSTSVAEATTDATVFRFSLSVLFDFDPSDGLSFREQPCPRGQKRIKGTEKCHQVARFAELRLVNSTCKPFNYPPIKLNGEMQFLKKEDREIAGTFFSSHHTQSNVLTLLNENLQSFFNPGATDAEIMLSSSSHYIGTNTIHINMTITLTFGINSTLVVTENDMKVLPKILTQVVKTSLSDGLSTVGIDLVKSEIKFSDAEFYTKQTECIWFTFKRQEYEIVNRTLILRETDMTYDWSGYCEDGSKAYVCTLDEADSLNLNLKSSRVLGILSLVLVPLSIICFFIRIVFQCVFPYYNKFPSKLIFNLCLSTCLALFLLLVGGVISLMTFLSLSVEQLVSSCTGFSSPPSSGWLSYQ